MRNYGDLSVCELRELCLNGELNADLMSLSDYERLFDYETDLDEPQSSVLVFCSNGLNQHEAYGKHLPKPSLESVYEKHEQMFGGKTAESKATPKVKKARRFIPTSRWGRLVATFVAVFIGAALLAQGVAYAFGYNLFGMIWQAISNSDRAAVDVSGDNQIFISDTRFYDSMEELLEAENLHILFPSILPNGYSFTHFEVDNTGGQPMLIMLAIEPIIDFRIRIGANFQFDFDYEINGIMYSIDEMGDGLYQGHWIDGEDYYTIVVSDRAIISEIINNLARE
jgi:hypothetical protein